jgi:type I restriction enzyme S subunit
MTEWREVAIGDLCVRTTSGGTPSRRRPEYFCTPPDGVPWVKSQELTDRRISRAHEHITESGLRRSSAKLLPPDTVLVAMYGATVGQLGYLAIPASVNQAICALIVDPDQTDPRFLYYALMHARGELIAHAHGAAQQNLSQDRIRAFTLRVPSSVEEQRAIGSVLGTVDDLIENDRRRIELLEEMAREIYREWFVRFQFPGHEDAPLVEARTGRIPADWEVRRLADVADITMGQSPPSRYYNEEGVGLPFHQGVTNFGWHFPEDRKFCTTDGRRAVAGDVLVSVRAPVGRTNVAPHDLMVGRGVAAIRSRTGCQSLLFRILRHSTFAEEDAIGGGTIFKAIGKTELQNVPVLVPPEDVAMEAERVFATNLEMVRVLTLQAARLGELRGLLLPKLISGQIDVSRLDLDNVLEATA